MSVDTELIDIPLSGGVDEKTRAELVAPPSMLTLSNLRQLKRGSQQKRYGNTLVSSATMKQGARRAKGPRYITDVDDAVGYGLSSNCKISGWRARGGNIEVFEPLNGVF